MDLAVGTGAMMVQAGDGLNKLNFTPVPSFLLAFEEGPDGQVQNVYRKVKVSVENITATWRDAELSPELERMLEDSPQKHVTLDEATSTIAMTINGDITSATRATKKTACWSCAR